MDAVTKIAYYFPTCAITSFWIIANLIINNTNNCSRATQWVILHVILWNAQQKLVSTHACEGYTTSCLSCRQLVSAVLALFCILVVVTSFTDTYTASNGLKFIVLLVPLYGPVCFSLPSDFDKDRVYEFYYLKVSRFIVQIASFIPLNGASCMLDRFVITSTLLFPWQPSCLSSSLSHPSPCACIPLEKVMGTHGRSLFISAFTVSQCIHTSFKWSAFCIRYYEQYILSNVCSIDASVVRTIPIVVALMTSLVMMCLGPPRQMIGFQNVEETCPPIEKQVCILCGGFLGSAAACLLVTLLTSFVFVSPQMGDNPIYNGDNPIYNGDQGPNGPGSESHIPEGDEDDYDGMPPPSYNSALGHLGRGASGRVSG